MERKKIWAGLAVLIMVWGCKTLKPAKKAGEEIGEAPTKKEVTQEPIEYANEKYDGKLVLDKTGIDFAHSFDCMGAFHNKIMERAEGPDGRLTSYTQVIKCSVTSEAHTLKYYGITYNELGQKNGYKVDLSCSKTGENYQLSIEAIAYDFYWEVLSYKVKVNEDTLIFPPPKEEKK
jgi:hypothetical protein